MSNFIPSKKTQADFNGGNKFVNNVDSISAQDINNVVEGLLNNQEESSTANKNYEEIRTEIVKLQENKLNKVVSGTFPTAYVADMLVQRNITVANPLLGIEQIPLYQDRKIRTATPTEPDHCVNKEYTDEIKEKVDLAFEIIGQTVITDTEVEDTYSVRETAGGLDIISGVKTTVNKIQGATATSKNLIPFPYEYLKEEKVVGPITLTPLANGGITITRDDTSTEAVQSTDIANKLRFKKAGTYRLYLLDETGTVVSNKGVSLVCGYYVNGSFVENKWGSITVTEEDIANGIGPSGGLRMELTNAFTGTLTVYPMVIYGETPLTAYEPYFADLKSAYFKGIESSGKNLFNPALYKGITVNEDGSVKTVNHIYSGLNTDTVFKGEPNTNYTICLYSLDKEPVHYTVADDKKLHTYIYINGSWKNMNGGNGIFTTNDKGEVNIKIGATADSTIAWKPFYVAIYKGTFAFADTPPYEPYTVDNSFTLDTAVELGKFDYIDVINKKLVRQTGTLTQDTVFTAEELANYTDYVLSADGKTIAYKLATATETSIGLLTDGYLAYNGGQETVIQGNIDNSESGAENTITQNYYVKVGG